MTILSAPLTLTTVKKVLGMHCLTYSMNSKYSIVRAVPMKLPRHAEDCHGFKEHTMRRYKQQFQAEALG